MADDSHEGELDPAVGLCSACRHATTQENAKGNTFWRCRAADGDERLMRYPPLPVRRCFAFAGRRP